MKKLLPSLLLAMAILAFTFNGCDKEDDICFATIEPLIERAFRLSIEVEYKDYEPYQGPISFVILKKYCDESTSGKYVFHGKGDEEGYWDPGQAPTYKFENALDIVTAGFSVSHPENESLLGEVFEDFYYGAVEKQYFGIEKTYYITLPWTADEEKQLQNMK